MDKDTEKTINVELKTWLYSAVETNPENFTYHLSNTLTGMVEAIDCQIWGRDLLPTFEFPFSWWDFIKLKYFPMWLLERYPAKIREVNIRELFPQVSKNPLKIKGADFLNTKNSVALLNSFHNYPLI